MIDNQRSYGLDFMKFMAAIMITNSHYIPLYKDVNVGLATLGVHGNALFFFVAGYLLMAGFEKQEEYFCNWFKKRLQRLWPAVFLWTLIASIVWGDSITWQKLILCSDYWFIECIVAYYAIFYVVGHMVKRWGCKALFLCIIISIMLSIALSAFIEKSALSLFHTEWHFVCHLSIMLIGGVAYKRRNCVSHTIWKDWFGFILSFLLYFPLVGLGKGHLDETYYFQLLGLIPLHTFCWYAYKVCSQGWCNRLMTLKGWRVPFVAIASLTLEIYIIQFHIITDKLNSLFPLNILAVLGLICVIAYSLRVLTDLFVQFMRNEKFNLKDVGRIL